MTSLDDHLRLAKYSHVAVTMGESFLIPGMYCYFDLPDLAAAIAPKSFDADYGSQDGLFPTASIRRISRGSDWCGGRQRPTPTGLPLV